MSRPRNPIKQLVACGFDARALDVAIFGRELTEIEEAVNTYLSGVKHSQESEKRFPSSKHQDQKKISELRAFDKEDLSKLVFDAIDKSDFPKLKSLAPAVEFMKKARGTFFDPTRRFLLSLKIRSMQNEEEFTFKQIRDYLWNRSDSLKDERANPALADGNAQLRRLCKEVGLRFDDNKKRRKRR
jgi:hypothetical protein